MRCGSVTIGCRIEVDAIGLDRAADVGQRFGLAGGLVGSDGRCGSGAGGGTDGQGEAGATSGCGGNASANETAGRAGRRGKLREPSLVRRDGLGQLLDQRAELADLGAERIGRRLRLVDRDADVLLHLGETPIHLGDLTRDIGVAARQVGSW